MDLRIRRLSPTAQMPRYQTAGAAGMDLCADFAITRPEHLAAYMAADDTLICCPGLVVKVPTGIAVEIPPGYEGQVRPRSGLASRGLTVANAPGTIDSDYRGEICVLLVNLSPMPIHLAQGDRIAQLVIAPVVRVAPVETDCIGATERGAGGFGSTGR